MPSNPDGPTAEKHAVDPLELTRSAIEETHTLLHMGAGTMARTMFRRRLEEIVRYMCPICGRTDDHETNDPGPEPHRFVAPRQLTLGDTGHWVGSHRVR